MEVLLSCDGGEEVEGSEKGDILGDVVERSVDVPYIAIDPDPDLREPWQKGFGCIGRDG